MCCSAVLSFSTANPARVCPLARKCFPREVKRAGIQLVANKGSLWGLWERDRGITFCYLKSSSSPLQIRRVYRSNRRFLSRKLLIFLFLVLHLWLLPSEAVSAGCSLTGLASQEAPGGVFMLSSFLLGEGKASKQMEISSSSLCIDVSIRCSV